MERRTYRRVAVTSGSRIPVAFSGDAKGRGTLYDLSPGGCKVGCTNTPPLGASLTLQLDVLGHVQPVKVDVGIVGWAIKGKYFGVKFVRVEAMDQLVLTQYSARLVTYSTASARGREGRPTAAI
jgi:hypothetical protein